MTAALIQRIDTLPGSGARLVRYAGAVLVALFLSFAPATPARADSSIDACFNAVASAAKAGIDQAKFGPEFVANGCAQWANPATAELFAAVSGIVTALEAAGAFKGGDCKDFIKSKIAGALIAALAASIGGNSPLSLIVNALPDSDKAKIEQLANNISSAGSEAAANEAAEQAYDLLANIPVVGQAVSMLPCACIVADAAIKSGNDLAKAASQTGDCAKFALQCVGNPLECAQSVFESGWDALQDLGQWVWDNVGGLLKDIWCDGPGQACNWIGLKSVCGCEGDPPPRVQVDCVRCGAGRRCPRPRQRR